MCKSIHFSIYIRKPLCFFSTIGEVRSRQCWSYAGVLAAVVWKSVLFFVLKKNWPLINDDLNFDFSGKTREIRAASERGWRLPPSPIVDNDMCVFYVVVVAVVVVVVAVDDVDVKLKHTKVEKTLVFRKFFVKSLCLQYIILLKKMNKKWLQS